MTMRREKPAAIFPEERPDLFEVALRHFQRGELVGAEETKFSFAMDRWQGSEACFDFKKKNQPVRLDLVAVFAYHSEQMQVGRLKFQTDFLLRLAAGAGIRGFADFLDQLSARRTPAAAVRFLRPFQQENFVSLVEAIEQRRDLVGQRHRGNFEGQIANVE